MGSGDASPREAPLDAPPPTAAGRQLGQELAALFNLLRADWLIVTEGPLPKFEDLNAANPGAFFAVGEQPRAVLFLSHRWNSIEHPDPTGRKADAVRQFLRHCERLGDGPGAIEAASSEELLVHGAFQAAHFVSRSKFFGEDPNSPFKDEVRFDPDRPILAQIAVWCDYTCLPQDGVSDRLRESLARIDELISESNLLILRCPEDEYETRAWCAMEMSATRNQLGRVHPKNLVLRLDKIGEPIDQGNASERFARATLPLRAKFGTAKVISLMFDRDLPEQEEYNHDLDTFTNKRTPELFEGMRSFLAEELQYLSRISNIDEILADQNVADADFGHDMEKMVREWLQHSGLKTTHKRDLAYTGLMVLFLRRRPWPETALFYKELLRRHLAGESLKLRRFREIRGLLPEKNRCWYLFSDAPPGAGNEPDWMMSPGLHKAKVHPKIFMPRIGDW